MPISISCVTFVAAVKFVFEAAEAVIVHEPGRPNVTSPPEIVQLPDAVNDGVTPDDEPVTVDIANAVGV